MPAIELNGILHVHQAVLRFVFVGVENAQVVHKIVFHLSGILFRFAKNILCQFLQPFGQHIAIGIVGNFLFAGNFQCAIVQHVPVPVLNVPGEQNQRLIQFAVNQTVRAVSAVLAQL